MNVCSLTKLSSKMFTVKQIP